MITICWSLWLERNNRVFEDVSRELDFILGRVNFGLHFGYTILEILRNYGYTILEILRNYLLRLVSSWAETTRYSEARSRCSDNIDRNYSL